MIVRDRPSPLRLFLAVRGPVLPAIWNSLPGNTGLPPPLLPAGYRLDQGP